MYEHLLWGIFGHKNQIQVENKNRTEEKQGYRMVVLKKQTNQVILILKKFDKMLMFKNLAGFTPLSPM